MIIIQFITLSMSSVWGKAWPILLAILFFGFIILIHELGHFTFAKLFKVKVNEFAIGMGPKLFKVQKQETQYSVRLFPIGGFVLMEGEDEDSDEEGAFNKKPVWQKIIIVSAGAIINIIFGIILMMIIVSHQSLIGTSQIAKFYDNAKSPSYGLQKGDKIIAVNGNKVYTDYDLSFFMMRDKDAVIDFTVKRGNDIEYIQGVKFQTKNVKGTTVVIYDFSIAGVKPTAGEVMKYGALESLSIVRIVWYSLFDLITMQYKMNELSGPIGTIDIIADTATQASKTMNYSSLLTIMAFITINIGVFNLLPLPALDGGRMFFLFIEGIRRKPVEPKYEGFVHSVGFALLMLLMVVVTFNDIVKLFKG